MEECGETRSKPYIVHIDLYFSERAKKENPMNINAFDRVIFIIILALVLLPGCASTPTIPEQTPGVVFEQPLNKSQKAAIDALVVLGFDINKQEPNYVEGFRPRKIGFFVGSGGETIGVWLESLGESRTKVIVDTAKSFVGIVGQRNWNEQVYQEMKKSLQ